jgi:hypothetical protein
LESGSAPLHAPHLNDFPLAGAGPADDVVGSSMPLPTVPSSQVAATPCGPGSGVQPSGSSVLSSDPVVSLSSVGAPLDSTASSSSSAAPPSRAHTHLQNAIVKQKRLLPSMIRYVNFCATSEPNSIKEALTDPRWKQAMDAECLSLFAISDMASCVVPSVKHLGPYLCFSN